MTKRNMTMNELVESLDEHTRDKVLERLDEVVALLDGARQDIAAMRAAVLERRYIEQTLMRGAPKAAQALNEAAVELTSAVIEHNTVDALVKAASSKPTLSVADQIRGSDAWEDHDPAPRDRVDHNSDVRKVIDDRKTDIGTDEEEGKFVCAGVLYFSSPLGDDDRAICAECGTREPQEHIGARGHALDRCPKCYDAFQRENLKPGMRVRVNDIPWSGEPERDPQFVGLTGEIVAGPVTTKAGTSFDVVLDGTSEEIARHSQLSTDEVREAGKRFEFEPRQLDDQWYGKR